MLKSYRFLVALLFLFAEAHASENGADIVEKDTVEKEIYSVEFSVISRTHELEFLDRSFENYIIFQPNIPYIFQTKFYFWNQELVISTDNVSDIGMDDQKVHSNYKDIEYSGFISKYEYTAYYGRYKGFYVNGQRDSSGDYFNFDEISTKRFGLDVRVYGEEPLLYSVNNKYSNKPHSLPKLFGTYVLGFLYDVSDIKNIPGDPLLLSQINNSDLIFFNNLKLVTLAPYAGVIGRISIKGYFLEAGLNIGYGLQRQEVELDGVYEDHIDYSFVGLGFMSIGKTIHGNGTIGFNYSMDTVEPSVEKNELAVATVDLSLFYKVYF